MKPIVPQREKAGLAVFGGMTGEALPDDCWCQVDVLLNRRSRPLSVRCPRRECTALTEVSNVQGCIRN